MEREDPALQKGQHLIVVKDRETKLKSWKVYVYDEKMIKFIHEIEVPTKLSFDQLKNLLSALAGEKQCKIREKDWSTHIFVVE
ncbi:hypothetical protein A2W67_03460 [Candidatus Nomurabacteria bacterium RIFCSPLOWO2_02_40_28]|uniref:Uncharacterized protein n=2 Tax=Candidatus Nomuraibacteriota TaxID=1752729 RepID=A0A837HS78_9BACT|nr:MAG: hypothetical protein UT27_C0004G0072 [Candidatus Nomurabacteria bacterium GW2011_GWD2_39_12]KKR20934.1 MAG: hypothetical protein UT51_C0001G0072 [Candidatus Nomurabacteria bacterium GW2011_GWC2_39_41]KKR37187.1 MAG: hypothetical protein UT70_C0002G0023 [Candidatus Nomurabacteria bacterium GW2011_GWE2_40_10]KKR38883.1 MAG: hypothetical protein UT73_C0001G0071 [Candidatus Nomurabacteria bacterium GW2011_GWB1_40_11]KKR40125.1 MAG: hypothetical protein UT74_C0002G0020 [Parcubacteria group b